MIESGMWVEKYRPQKLSETKGGLMSWLRFFLACSFAPCLYDDSLFFEGRENHKLFERTFGTHKVGLSKS